MRKQVPFLLLQPSYRCKGFIVINLFVLIETLGYKPSFVLNNYTCFI